jgi:hypothetical protein
MVISGEAELDLGQQFIVQHQVPTGNCGHRLAGDIIHSGAQAPAGDHHVRAGQGLLQDSGDAPLIVTDRRLAIEVEADSDQFLSDVGRVDVFPFAQQKFCANG